MKYKYMMYQLKSRDPSPSPRNITFDAVLNPDTGEYSTHYKIRIDDRQYIEIYIPPDYKDKPIHIYCK